MNISFFKKSGRHLLLSIRNKANFIGSLDGQLVLISPRPSVVALLVGGFSFELFYRELFVRVITDLNGGHHVPSKKHTRSQLYHFRIF